MTDLGVAPITKNFSMHHVCRNTDAYLVKSPTYSVLLSYISVNLILFSNRLGYFIFCSIYSDFYSFSVEFSFKFGMFECNLNDINPD